jgi:hypothetical protein
MNVFHLCWEHYDVFIAAFIAGAVLSFLRGIK